MSNASVDKDKPRGLIWLEIVFFSFFGRELAIQPLRAKLIFWCLEIMPKWFVMFTPGPERFGPPLPPPPPPPPPKLSEKWSSEQTFT